MNATVLAVSVMSLGIMVGITATHYQHVDHLVKHGVPSVIVDPAPHVELNGTANDNLTLVKRGVVSPQVNTRSGKSTLRQRNISARSDISQANGSGRDEVLLEILAAMREEQKAIRKQISESNRDIDELTFRVDTHSDSFKPLHSTEVDRPRSLRNNGAIMSTDSTGAGLLPPKQ